MCTISTSMVPFTVYFIQRALKVWPRDDPGNYVGFYMWIRPGWVVMEIATMGVGVGYLSFACFPFLLFPVSFSMWFLSMDLSPLWPGWEKKSYSQQVTVRVRVSIAMGVLMMALGYVSESTLGSDPDLGFWLYFFGLLTFWIAIKFDFPSSDIYGSLFLMVNMGLVLIGSHLDRTTFLVFGTLGVIEYVGNLCTARIKTTNSLVLWVLKALAAAALFSQAVRRDGNIEVLGGLVCVLAFNFNYIHFLNSSSLYSIFFLATNLGFVGVSNLFSRPLDLWLFTIPNIEPLFALITSLTPLLYHVKIATKYFKEPLSDLFAHVYLAFRFVLSIALSVVFVFLRQPHFSWVGGVGIVMVTFCYHLRSNSNDQQLFHVISLMGYLFGVAFAIFLQSNLLYLLCCVALLHFTMNLLHKQKLLGCTFAVLLVLVSIPLNSKFLITIGAIYVISYLTHLAYSTFKNSLLFPLALICLGVAMIAVAVEYQQYEVAIQESFFSLIPDVLRALLSRNIRSFLEAGTASDWLLYLSKTELSWGDFVECPLKWVLWPGALTNALIHSPVLYVTYTYTLGLLVLLVMVALQEVRRSMEKHLDGKIEVIISSVLSGINSPPPLLII